MLEESEQSIKLVKTRGRRHVLVILGPPAKAPLLDVVAEQPSDKTVRSGTGEFNVVVVQVTAH